jgi:RNA polymerase sigma factor (TIGR02999 family)
MKPDEAPGEVPPDAPGQVTRILSNWDQLNDPASELLPLVYTQLCAIARNRMNNERAGHTLQATALVHEAYMKLVRIPESGVKFDGRGRFFAAAAEAMRRILIDHARRRKAAKRGDAKVPLDQLVEDPADLDALPDPDRLLALNDALDVLTKEDARAAEVVRLRYFAGLNAEETAQVMNLSERTVHREWTFARARLHELLKDD